MHRVGFNMKDRKRKGTFVNIHDVENIRLFLLISTETGLAVVVFDTEHPCRNRCWVLLATAYRSDIP